MLNIHAIERAFIYGPGARAVIWFQGCTLHCKGCWNVKLWDFSNNQLYTSRHLLDTVRKLDVEGVTLLGGEPLDQDINELTDFINECRANGLSIVLFTGYELTELKDSRFKNIASNVDILVSGRYDENKRTTSSYLIGSLNQSIDFISNRYSEKDMKPDKNYVEVKIDKVKGNLTILGFPDDSLKGIL